MPTPEHSLARDAAALKAEDFGAYAVFVLMFYWGLSEEDCVEDARWKHVRDPLRPDERGFMLTVRGREVPLSGVAHKRLIDRPRWTSKARFIVPYATKKEREQAVLRLRYWMKRRGKLPWHALRMLFAARSVKERGVESTAKLMNVGAFLVEQWI